MFDKVKKYGIIGCIVRFFNKASYRVFRFFNRMDVRITEDRLKKKRKKRYDYLASKINNPKYKYVFLFFPYVEWNLPIFQRPQQIALELTKREDVLYFFCTPNFKYDNIKDLYEQINDNLFVITDFDFVANFETKKRVLHLYSTDIISDYSIVEDALKRNDNVLYEYIDEIHEEITHALPKKYIEKHNKILKNESCYVIASADKLYNDVKKVRNKHFALATNGVNINDFIRNENDEIPTKIQEIRKKYDKILCYYGSLAVWFDYELIKKISKRYPNYAIVLIGVEYDESLKKSNISKFKNVFYLGKIDYYELHKYSENSDLLMIPFLINDITESTSPVKLFEYMATNIPILTTDMPECRKYKSVIIGKNHEDFLAKIDSTIELINNKEYLKIEMQEAKENTWTQKANAIVELLDSKKDGRNEKNNKKS